MNNSTTINFESKTSRLLGLAVKGLVSMYDEEKRIFCHRLIKSAGGMEKEGISQRYTIMILLGLHRAQVAGLQHPFDVEALSDELLNHPAWLNNAGDLGLLLWLCAVASESRLSSFSNIFELNNALTRFSDARQQRTMELSWLLTGLVHATQIRHLPDIEKLAHQVYGLLAQNQGSYGFFGHMAASRSLPGLVRGKIGSFADQVYPILAMASYARVFKDTRAYEKALFCARAICRVQGCLGQWWWHYDSSTGRVVEHYPVYSVHQHAMGPMALFALEETGTGEFLDAISRGLAWIHGDNELRQNLEDAELGLIWRCIRSNNSASILQRFQAAFWNAQAGSLHTLYECRPYELGWLLYALAHPLANNLQEPRTERNTPAVAVR